MFLYMCVCMYLPNYLPIFSWTCGSGIRRSYKPSDRWHAETIRWKINTLMFTEGVICLLFLLITALRWETKMRKMDPNLKVVLMKVLIIDKVIAKKSTSQSRYQTWYSHVAGRFFDIWATREATDTPCIPINKNS